MKKTDSISLFVALLVVAASWFMPACSTARSSSRGDIDLPGMDKSVAPGEDFNAYANGGWIKATSIPADKARYGIFDMLMDETRKRTVDLIQGSANGATTNAGEDAQKIGDFYSSFMT